MQNGMSTPTMISIQKYGAVAPKNIWDRTFQPPSVPGYAVVRSSQPTM